MKPTEDPIFGMLEGLEAPKPPSCLRRETLAAAESAMQEPARDLWWRLWTYRPVRLVYLGTAAACLLAHVLISLPRSPGDTVEATWASVPQLLEDDLAEVLDVPRFRLTRLAFLGENSLLPLGKPGSPNPGEPGSSTSPAVGPLASPKPSKEPS